MTRPPESDSIPASTHRVARQRQVLWADPNSGWGLYDDGARAQVEHRMAEARPRLVRLARAHGIAADSADDVAQETLLEAWRHLDRLATPEGFDAWLNGICRNVCRRAARAHGALAGRQIGWPDVVGWEDVDWSEAEEPALAESAGCDPYEELDRRDLQTLLDRALAWLPGQTRRAVTLCYLAGLPQHEAALRLGLTTRAVESRLLRARKRLREVLASELRAEAQAFGLALGSAADDEEATGWRATRLWCWWCGRCRMQGSFERLPDGRVALAMRCPGCERRFSTQGVTPLGGTRSFRPAYKRLSRHLSGYLADGVVRGWQTCVFCGARQPVRLVDAAERGGRRGHWPGLVARMECGACGGHVDSPATALVWSHPEAQRFMAEYPQWIGEPEERITFEGAAAIRVLLKDATGAARLTLVTDARTLEVLATWAE